MRSYWFNLEEDPKPSAPARHLSSGGLIPKSLDLAHTSHHPEREKLLRVMCAHLLPRKGKVTLSNKEVSLQCTSSDLMPVWPSTTSIQLCAAPGGAHGPCPAQEPCRAGTHHPAAPSRAVSQGAWLQPDLHKTHMGLHCDLHPTHLHSDLHNAGLARLL